MLSVLGQLLLGCCFRSFHRDIDTFRSVAIESLILNADSTAKRCLSILSWALTKLERIQQNSNVCCSPGPWSDEAFHRCLLVILAVLGTETGTWWRGGGPYHQAISAALLLSWLFILRYGYGPPVAMASAPQVAMATVSVPSGHPSPRCSCSLWVHSKDPLNHV